VDSVRFAVDADAYDRYMGRYSARLAPVVRGLARVTPSQRVKAGLRNVRSRHYRSP
jgi:hypothetical protein